MDFLILYKNRRIIIEIDGETHTPENSLAHVSHILDKLDVKRRAEARTAAKKLNLVQDDL